jgi:hypothetical protein
VHASFRLLTLSVALVSFWEPTVATSIVLLSNKTQIAVAADSRVTGPHGHVGPDICKIWRHGNFFFVFSGTVSRGSIPDTRFNAMDILVRASRGLNNFEEIDHRFDQLIRAPLQEQLDYDFAHDRESFRERMQVKEPPVLELVIFGMTPNGPEMVQSVITVSFTLDRAKLGKTYHHSCKSGVGDCFLTAGTQDEIQAYLKDHALSGDLATDAERLVKIEAAARPQTVGGPIRVILVDRTGVDKKDPQDPCPTEWREPH